MRKRRLHINRILAVVLLWVFSLTIIPWSTLHHHDAIAQETCSAKKCTHQVHIKAHADTCLICTAHFERDYLVTNSVFELFLHSSPLVKCNPTLGSAYTTLISTALRGPPAQA